MDSRVVVRGPGGPAMPWRASLFLLIPVFIGIVMVWVAVVMQQQEDAYAREGREANASVTGKAIVPGSADDPDQYRLSYSFATPDGRIFSGSAAVSPETYRQADVGDPVTVSYLASHPATNRVRGAVPALVVYLMGIGGSVIVLLAGAALVRNSLRLIRGDQRVLTRIAPRGAPEVTYVFQRPASRVLIDLLAPPIGATMFLGGAWLIGLSGTVDADAIARVAFLLGFGFFGVLLLAATPYGLRRGLRRSVLEVGPQGIWIPEMGRLAWNEIREIRLEAVPSPASAEPGGRATYGRLGVVPVDPAREQAVRQSLAWRMVGGLARLLRRSRPNTPVTDLDEIAAFGIFDYDLGGSLDQAIAAVRRYRDLVAVPPEASKSA